MISGVGSAINSVESENFDAGGLKSAIESAASNLEVKPVNINFSEYNWEGVSPELDALNSELSNLEGLYGTLMQNMDSFASFYNDNSIDVSSANNLVATSANNVATSSNNVATSSNNVAQATNKAVDALNDMQQKLIAIADIRAAWSDSPTLSAKIKLDAISANTGIHATIDNFLQSFNKVASGLNKEQLDNWSKYSSALLSVKNAEEAYQKTLEDKQQSIFKLQQEWGTDTQEKAAKASLEFTIKRTKILGVTADNFLDRFNERIKSSITTDEIKKWQELSSAIKKAHQLKIKNISKEIDFYKNIGKEINDAYTGTLSYLNTHEKNIFLSKQAEKYKAKGDNQSYIKTLKEQLQNEKKMSATREDYAIKFDKYIQEVKAEKPKNK